MSIFNKPSGDRSMTRPDPTNGETAMSVIGAGMRIVGNIDTAGVVKVEGTIEGAIRGAKQVLLGRSGVIHGDIHAADAVLGGKVVGSIVATERVELQATASIEGDVSTRSIVVFEGGQINGTVRMGDAAIRTQGTPAIRLAADA
jgi:cytoskeletal protein CcmA (bactofilin family)